MKELFIFLLITVLICLTSSINIDSKDWRNKITKCGLPYNFNCNKEGKCKCYSKNKFLKKKNKIPMPPITKRSMRKENSAFKPDICPPNCKYIHNSHSFRCDCKKHNLRN